MAQHDSLQQKYNFVIDFIKCEKKYLQRDLVLDGLNGELIELIKPRRSLWVKTQNLYKDAGLKNNEWQELHEELKVNLLTKVKLYQHFVTMSKEYFLYTLQSFLILIL